MKNIFISPKENIRSAMKQLNNIAERCLLVAKDDKLLGTLTDGDIRRNILATKKINGLVENAYNKNPHVIKEEVYDKKIAVDILKKEKIDLIPIIDSNKTIKNFITWDSLGGNINYDRKVPHLNKTSVVIMSGGKGTRLQPFTSVLPKPLIPIKGKTMLEHIIANFVKYGVKDFFVTVNYKSKILKAYFEELNPKYNITFIEEHKPLGTSGSLKYLSGKINDNFFVTNCDIIIRHDYPRIFNFHNKNKNDITLIASTKQFLVPYGTCELNDEGTLLEINEKPKFDYLVNTGFYIINPDILELIPDNTFFHITELIEVAINDGKKVGVFPIDEDNWVDVGQWSEYKDAVSKL